MCRNDALGFVRYAEDLAGTTRNVSMARSVKAVATHTVFRVHAVRQGVHIGIIGHRLVESGVEYCHLRGAREDFLHRFDTEQIRRIMERSKSGTFYHFSKQLFGDQYTRSKLFCSVYDAVTHGVNLFEALNAPISSIR